MSIPKTLKINPYMISPLIRGRKIEFGKLPTTPGVYLFKDGKEKVVYVGKATNLRSRVGSYWKYTEAEPPVKRRLGLAISGRPIEEMVHEVKRIDYVTTDSVIEALILEANLIRKYMPPYNVKEKDDKSFLYVVITKEAFPKVQLVRGNELNMQKDERGRFSAAAENLPQGFLRVFGPYTSASSIRAALDLIRKWFPWGCMTRKDTEDYGKTRRRPCFDYHIGRCPGVCIGAISRREYMKNIRNVILMLEGKKAKVMQNLELRMKNAAKAEKFEEAEMLKRKLFALRHIRDVAVLTHDTERHGRLRKDTEDGAINVLGRVEGYDISNISGMSAVGSMVVFKDGEPCKSGYRRFRIKGVREINDVGMMREVLKRRFAHAKPPLNLPLAKGEKEGIRWPLPDLMVIDGGWGQVNVVREVLKDLGFLPEADQPLAERIKVIGIAKGFKRKQDRPVFDKDDMELSRIVENYKDLLLQVRDEAHRFAVRYHRKVRGKIST